MPEEFQIRISPTIRPHPVQTLFTVMDWTWPVLALAGLCAIVVLDSQLTISRADGFSLSYSAGPFAVLGTLIFVATAVAKFFTHRRAKRTLRAALKGRSQFIDVGNDGLRYGWEGAASFFWAWEAIASVAWREDEALLRINQHRLKINLSALSRKEKDGLHYWLKARTRLGGRNPPRPTRMAGKDGETPPASPQE